MTDSLSLSLTRHFNSYNSLSSLNISNIRSMSSFHRFNDSTFHSQMEKDVLLPKYLQDNNQIKKADTPLLLKDIKGGYTSYQVLFKISSVSHSNILNYLENIQEFINGLEDNKIYTILVQAVSFESHSYASICLVCYLFIGNHQLTNFFIFYLFI